VVERYLYTPYGKVTVLDSGFFGDADGESDSSNTTLYTGRTFDRAIGPHYYRHRICHAQLGRFVSRDPIAYKAGWHLYAYVANLPTAKSDPMGLVPPDWINPFMSDPSKFPDISIPGEPPGLQLAAETFHVCSRPVRGEGLERNTARQCNCEHVGISGNKSGMIHDGWNGPVPITNRGLPAGPDVKCTELKRVYDKNGFHAVPWSHGFNRSHRSHSRGSHAKLGA